MTTAGQPLRFGLVGTGYWARITHAPALASTEGITLAAVWGRNPAAATALAAEHGATPHTDIDSFLADVDAVAFSVPPNVQSEIAVRAANAGKHLLLEKPIALAETDADNLVRAVENAGVASVVFFTSRFQHDVRTWLADVERTGGWAGGNAVWIGGGLADDNPFSTPWRREKGALWDLGPHAVSMLWAVLGPVVSVTADHGQGDLSHVVLHHRGGATSTVTLTFGSSEAAAGFDLWVWGSEGRSTAPTETETPQEALRVALAELADNARSGKVSHPCDVRFGRDIGHVLAQAQRQIDAAT
jgi:predicted dehydrogenase